MTLIEAEQDDAAVLAAEDKAIIEAARPVTADSPLDDLVRLLSDVPEVPEATEASGGPRR